MAAISSLIAADHGGPGFDSKAASFSVVGSSMFGSSDRPSPRPWSFRLLGVGCPLLQTRSQGSHWYLYLAVPYSIWFQRTLSDILHSMPLKKSQEWRWCKWWSSLSSKAPCKDHLDDLSDGWLEVPAPRSEERDEQDEFRTSGTRHARGPGSPGRQSWSDFLHLGSGFWVVVTGVKWVLLVKLRRGSPGLHWPAPATLGYLDRPPYLSLLIPAALVPPVLLPFFWLLNLVDDTCAHFKPRVFFTRAILFSQPFAVDTRSKPIVSSRATAVTHKPLHPHRLLDKPKKKFLREKKSSYNMHFSTVTALAVMAVSQAVAEPINKPVRVMMSAREIFGLAGRDNGGYQPSQSYCGQGATCSEACGAGYATCPSSDNAIHCYNKDAAQSCCPDNSGSTSPIPSLACQPERAFWY